MDHELIRFTYNIENSQKHYRRKYKRLKKRRTKRKLQHLYTNLTKFHAEVLEEVDRLKNVIEMYNDILTENIEEQPENFNQQNGLTTERIQKFQSFLADETLNGENCIICLDDIDVGRRMKRLDCDGQHVFCQKCVEKWFADHNICPLCNHIFQ